MRRGMRCKFFVYIVESPSSEDFFSDTAEAKILYEGLRLLDITVFRRICTSEELFQLAITKDLPAIMKVQPDRYPIIHISAHADANGSALTNDDEINWRSLRKQFRKINLKSNGRLIVCLSMCNGMSALAMAESYDTPPFYALVGHTAKPSWADTALGFLTFYRRREAGAKLAVAVDAMREESGDVCFDWCLGDRIRGEYLDAA